MKSRHKKSLGFRQMLAAGAAVLVLASAATGSWSLQVAWLPLWLVPVVLYGTALAFILASVGVYVRDIGQATPAVTSLLMFLTPIFYPMAAIPASTYRDALVCFTNPLERFDFARLTMPVLMMTGQHDRLAPPAEIRSVAGRIWDSAPQPDVRFEVIADAGHVCNVEQPESYSRILTEFLRRLPQ